MFPSEFLKSQSCSMQQTQHIDIEIYSHIYI
jgi:citrate lyase synthetase